MLSRMLVRRTVATADMAANQTDPQVHPTCAYFEAILAALCARRHFLDLFDVFATHGNVIEILSEWLCA